ncbi:orange carotenoid protein N-terminal domain-containing protein [Almyronema epifaneia]|uniref:Orange carotenoid protein N-terminal domain-containing protein n=1 Tax=Almyronema epifaneia S1 TaxID=2991925 RepID=A0ABW6IC96_9CYAN
MAYAVSDAVKQAIKLFQNFDADTQLAVLWYGYLDIKDQLSPAPAHSAEVTGTAVYDRIKALDPNQQLQAQRDIANHADTPISREYGALSSSGKLEVWLLLAQGIESGDIIAVPDDYKLPEKTETLVNTIQSTDFEQRINFTRSVVDEMGFSPVTAG